MKKPLLPLGVDNFRTLVTHRNADGEQYSFTDKTLFIRDVINAGDIISLITRPRRFGKTINMSMLQHFFAKEVNGVLTEGLFDGLEISKYPEIMDYQGKYPVIFLTLKEIRGKDFKEVFERIKIIFSGLFKTHKYLLDSLSDDEKIIFNKILIKEANKEEYESSLKFLSRLLYQHTGKQAIILLGEYDTPLHDAYVNEYYEDMRSFIATMFNKAFKGNDFLYKAIITGILKVTQSSLFSELNNVAIYSTLYSRKYADKFGFTETETDDLLTRAHLPKKAHELKEIYNGYQIEEYTLFNPYSIVSFISNAITYEEPKDIEKAIRPY